MPNNNTVCCLSCKKECKNIRGLRFHLLRSCSRATAIKDLNKLKNSRQLVIDDLEKQRLKLEQEISDVDRLLEVLKKENVKQ